MNVRRKSEGRSSQAPSGYICGNGPSLRKPCQASKLSAMNAVSAPTVQMSAIPSRKNSPVAAAPLRSAPTKRDNAAPQVLPAANAPRIIAVSRATMRRPSLLRWTRSRGEVLSFSVCRQQFRRVRDMGGDIGKPSVEQTHEEANAGQEEYRRQRHLNRVRGRVQRQVGRRGEHRSKPLALRVGGVLAFLRRMLRPASRYDMRCADASNVVS